MKYSDKYNPYIGLRTYSKENSNIFWGRNNEIANLYNQVLSRKSTIISGSSGSGKSSLINAGLIPELNKDGYIDIKISANEIIQNSPGDIWKSISLEIDKAVKDYSLKVIIQNNLDPTPKYGLWEKINHVKYKDELGFVVHFVFIIDQIEVIFQKDFNLKEISDFLSIYQGLCVNSFSVPSNTLIENGIIHNKTSLDSGISNNRHKFVIAVRQDFLFEIDRYSTIFPLLQQNRFHLAILNEEQARIIITSSINNNGEHWFKDEEALEIIKRLTSKSDFDFDGIPEREIDATLLSLYLEQTVKERIKGYNNKDLPNTEHILYDYYKDHMNIQGIEELEKRLISDSGLYRQQITLKDALSYTTKKNLRELINAGILHTYGRNTDTVYVELHHDKLCQCAVTHINICNSYKNNALHFSAGSYLSMKNRTLHENSFWFISHGYAEYFTLIKWKSFIISKITNQETQNTGDFSGLFKDTSNAHSYSVLLKLSSKNGDGDKCTYDGIAQFELKYVKGLLYSLSFRDKDSNKYALYTGVASMDFYYDSEDRLILVKFKDVNDQKQIVQDGYSALLYKYSSNKKLPSETFYIDLPSNVSINPRKESHIFYDEMLKYNARHAEGNYGYRSEYDIFGCEVERIFINIKGEESPLYEGFSRIRMEKTEDDRLLSLSYYNSGNPTVNEADIHCIKITYNDNNSGYQCNFYDKDLLPTMNNEEISGTKIVIDYEQKSFKLFNLGLDGGEKEDKDGTKYQLCQLDDAFNIVNVKCYDTCDKLCSYIENKHLPNGLITSCIEYNSQNIKKNSYQYNQYDKKCRVEREHMTDNIFNEIVMEYEWDEEGLEACVKSKNNKDNGFTMHLTDRGRKRIFSWSDGILLKINVGKNNKFYDGIICDKDGNKISDPDYNANEISHEYNYEDYYEGKVWIFNYVRLFKNNGNPVRKEFFNDEQELIKIEVLSENKEWKIFEYNEENYYTLWDKDEKGRRVHGVLYKKNKDKTIETDTSYDISYENDWIQYTKYSNNIPEVTRSYQDDTLRKEYCYDKNGKRNIKIVKYFEEDPAFYALYDESTAEPQATTDEHGIHRTTIERSNDEIYDYEAVIHYNLNDSIINGPKGWAVKLTQRRSKEQLFEINQIKTTYCDSEFNHIDAQQEFDLYGSELLIYFIGNNLIGYELYHMPIGKEKKTTTFLQKILHAVQYKKKNKIIKEKELYTKLHLHKRKRVINKLFTKELCERLGYKKNSFIIHELSPKVVQIHRQTHIDNDITRIYYVTNQNQYKELIFMNGENIIFRNVIHYGYSNMTTNVIEINNANPQKDWNLKDNDIILKFGEWSFFDYEDSNTMADEFERIFNERQEKEKKTDIIIARITDNNWQCYKGEIEFKKDTPSLGRLCDKTTLRENIEIIRHIYNEKF